MTGLRIQVSENIKNAYVLNHQVSYLVVQREEIIVSLQR